MCTVMRPHVGWRPPPFRVGLQHDGLGRDRGDLEGPAREVDGRVDRGARRVPSDLLHDVGRQQVGEEHLPVGEGVWKTTVTVRPLLLPVIDAMSR